MPESKELWIFGIIALRTKSINIFGTKNVTSSSRINVRQLVPKDEMDVQVFL
jgi:hypothetical protein